MIESILYRFFYAADFIANAGSSDRTVETAYLIFEGGKINDTLPEYSS